MTSPTPTPEQPKYDAATIQAAFSDVTGPRGRKLYGEHAAILACALTAEREKVARAVEALARLEKWVTDGSQCETAAQRAEGRLALILAREVLASQLAGETQADEKERGG